MKKKLVLKLLVFVVVWLMLSLSFCLNLTKNTANHYVADIDPYSDGIMIADLVYHNTYNGNNYLLNALNPDIDPSFTHEKLVNDYLSGTAPAQDIFAPYTSNITIHRFLYRFINFLIPNRQVALQCMYTVNACLLALVLTIGIYLMYCWCKSWLWVAVSSVSVAFFMPTIDSYSENLYWSIFVIFLPCIVTLWDAVKNYNSLIAGRKTIPHLFLVAFFPCLLKNLFCFEFITTVMVSVMLPYVYLWCVLWYKDNFTKAIHNIKLLLVPAAGAVSAFFAAVCVRVILTSLYLGSFSAGISNFIGNLSYRLIDGAETYQSSWQLIHQSSQLPALSFKNVFDVSFFKLWVIGLVCLIFINIFSFRSKALFGIHPFPLNIVFLCSSFGSVSWFIFANPHANIHLWLTPLLYYIPTVFLLLFIIVIVLKSLVLKILRMGQIIRGKDRRVLLWPALARFCVFIVSGLICADVICWIDCLIVSSNVKSTAARLGTFGDSELYWDSSNTLYFIGPELSEKNLIDVRLFVDEAVPSFTRQPMYNPDQGCLEYQVLAVDLQQTHAFLFLSRRQVVCKMTIPNYLYNQIDWAVYTPSDSQTQSFSTYKISTETLTSPLSIQPAEITDENWTNGISNTDADVVLVPTNLSLFKAIGQSYITDSGKTVTIIDIIPEENWMHLQFDQSIDLSDGYPNCLSQR